MIRVGTWIHTDFGWGRIDQIEDAGTRLPAKQFLRAERRHRLRITLRPLHDAEPVLVDLQAGEIEFLEAKTLARCAKCKAFYAQDRYAIVSRHDPVAHDNVGPKYEINQPARCSLSEHLLKFSYFTPDNQWR